MGRNRSQREEHITSSTTILQNAVEIIYKWNLKRECMLSSSAYAVKKNKNELMIKQKLKEEK